MEQGSAVTKNGIVGIVSTIDRSQGLMWIIWPDNCGLSNCLPINSVDEIAKPQEILSALQSIAPRAEIASPFERALGGSRSSGVYHVPDNKIEVIDNRPRPYYDSKEVGRR